MSKIYIETTIHAPIKRCFDLARSIDLHKLSLSHTQEEAIAGVTTGLIGLSEEVTWKAKHFGVWQTLTSRITRFDRPTHFRDSMVKGIFRRFDHDHFFESYPEHTLMKDLFEWQSPLGALGVLADALFVKRHLRELLEARNLIMKEVAETEKWREILDT